MAMVGSEIERLIRQAFPDAHVIVVDMAGDGDHFAARIASEAFKGKSRIQQHQMVYSALQGKWAEPFMHSRSRLQSPNEWTASCIEVSEFMQFLEW